MAMANLRDGGIIVIGVSQRGEHWDLSGISEADLSTFDPDTVSDILGTYSTPAVDHEIVVVPYVNDARFLTFHIREFASAPHICKRDGPPRSGLVAGALFVRPQGAAKTSKIGSAEEMTALLELAATKRARGMIEIAKRIGFVSPDTSAGAYDKELGGL